MSEERNRTLEQELAAFILNEAKRDYNRLGYFPVAPWITRSLVELKREGKITRDEMLIIYRTFAGRPDDAAKQDTQKAEE